MITDRDLDRIESRLTKTFATKKEFEKLSKTFATKEELKTEIIKESNRIIDIMVKEFHTVFEMIGDTNERIDETNRRMDERFAKVDKRFDDVNKRLDFALYELQHNCIVLGSHESRLQHLEQSRSSL